MGSWRRVCFLPQPELVAGPQSCLPPVREAATKAPGTNTHPPPGPGFWPSGKSESVPVLLGVLAAGCPAEGALPSGRG